MAFPSATRNIRRVKLSRESLDLLSSMGSNFSDERTRESRWGQTKLRVYPGKIEGRKEVFNVVRSLDEVRQSVEFLRGCETS